MGCVCVCAHARACLHVPVSDSAAPIQLKTSRLVAELSSPQFSKEQIGTLFMEDCHSI